MPLRIAAVFLAAVGQYAQQLGLVAIEEGNDPVIEQISRRDRCLAIAELGAGDFGGVWLQMVAASGWGKIWRDGRPAYCPLWCAHTHSNWNG